MQQVTSECDCEMWSERYELDKESPIHLLLDFQVGRGPCLGERWLDNETYRCFFLHQSDIGILLLSGECKACVIVKWVVPVGVGVLSRVPDRLAFELSSEAGTLSGRETVRQRDNQVIFRFLWSVIVILLLLSGECETQVRVARWTMGTSWEWMGSTSDWTFSSDWSYRWSEEHELGDLSLLRSPQLVERRFDNEICRSFFLSIGVILSSFLLSGDYHAMDPVLVFLSWSENL